MGDVVDTKTSSLRALAGGIIERMMWLKQLGVTFDGKRNLYEAFGYSEILSVAQYIQKYERGGIAGRIVDAFPKATWRGGVQLVENDDPKQNTPFEAAWQEMAERLDLVPILQQADILSRLSTFSIIYIGAPGTDLTQELPRGDGTPKGIAYLRPYIGSGGPNSRRTVNDTQAVSMTDAMVDSLDTDITSPRFGKPKAYKLRPMADSGDGQLRLVHWSRVLHIADNALGDQIYGEPALRRVWNYLDDLDKIVGGGAEAFFQLVNPGRVWNIDKDIPQLDTDAKKDFTEQIQAFQHGMLRDMRMRGVKVQELTSKPSDFSSQVDSLLTLISGATTLPKRILTGSEMGELASSQDRENWRDQINGRRETYAGPFIIKRLVKHLLDYNYLPPSKTWRPEWGTVLNLTEDEKKAGALSWASTNRAYGSTVFPDDQIRSHWYGFEALTPEQKKPVAAPPEKGPTPQDKLRAAVADSSLVHTLTDALQRGDSDAVLDLIGLGGSGSPDDDDTTAGQESKA